MKLLCKVCDRAFHLKPSKVKTGRGQFCSRACRDKGVLSTRRKLTLQQVCEIRERYRPRKISCRMLGEQYGIALQNVWRIVAGKAWV